jgi:hypothetical protein
MGTDLDSVMTVESVHTASELIISIPDTVPEHFLTEAAVSVDTTTVQVVLTHVEEPAVITLDAGHLGHPPKMRKARHAPVSAGAHIAQQTEWHIYPKQRAKSGRPAMAAVSMRWSGLPSFGVSTLTRWAMPSALGTALASAGLALATLMLLGQAGAL